MKSKKLHALTLLLTIFLFSCDKWDNDTLPVAHNFNTDYYPHEVPARWMDLQLKLIKRTTGYTPPVASRSLAYTSLALYESIVPGMAGYRPANQAFGFNYTLPDVNPKKSYNWVIVANDAMRSIMTNLYEGTANKTSIDSLYNKMLTLHGITLDEEQSVASKEYGKKVAEVIYNWSKTDNADKAYNNSYPSGYTIPVGPGLWIPTPPAYQPTPLQPYWGSNRPFIAGNVTGECLAPAPIPFSTDTASDFYKQAYEVYTVSKNLTPYEEHTALFWADGSGTFTPPGHMMNIATFMLESENAKLTKAAEVYLRMGIACADAFISCWKTKYTYNVIRPVSYIRAYIDPEWTPLITTPPFPEYASGHSTVSGACAEVLTAIYGGNVEIIDHTNDSPTMEPWGWNSFYHGAEMAAMSRLYGGIHYRNSNEQGLKCGKAIGKNVMSVRLRN